MNDRQDGKDCMDISRGFERCRRSEEAALTTPRSLPGKPNLRLSHLGLHKHAQLRNFPRFIKCEFGFRDHICADLVVVRCGSGVSGVEAGVEEEVGGADVGEC